MNAKRCKQIRKALKAQGIDVRHTEYRRTGTARIYTQSLVPSCGRAIYRAAKVSA